MYIDAAAYVEPYMLRGSFAEATDESALNSLIGWLPAAQIFDPGSHIHGTENGENVGESGQRDFFFAEKQVGVNLRYK